QGRGIPFGTSVHACSCGGFQTPAVTNIPHGQRPASENLPKVRNRRGGGCGGGARAMRSLLGARLCRLRRCSKSAVIQRTPEVTQPEEGGEGLTHTPVREIVAGGC